MTDTQAEIPVTENRIEKLIGINRDYSEYFGNGNQENGELLLSRIALKLANKRKAEPVFAEGQYHGLGKIEENFRDFSQAVLKHDFRQGEKAVALIASLIRFLNNEHHPEICEE